MGIADNSHSSLVGVMAVLLGFITSVNLGIQAYSHASLPFAWFFFALAFTGTCIACVLLLTSLPPLMQCINDVSEEAHHVEARAEELGRTANIGSLTANEVTSFRDNLSSVLNRRILPGRLIQKRILLLSL